MVTFEYLPQPKPNHQRTDKPTKVDHKRSGPTQRQRSELPPKEAKRLKERSNGVCERCDKSRATGGKAHAERRWKSKGKPTAEQFIHLCITCHEWADSTKAGRAWLLKKQKELQGKVTSPPDP